MFCKHWLFIFLWRPSIVIHVMQYIYKRLGIKIKTANPYIHCSLRRESHIKSIGEMIAKQLTGTGQM